MTKEDAIRWLEDIHRRFNPTRENLENEGGDVHLQALDMAIEALQDRPTGRWIDYSDEGYVECPFCHSATNCDENKDELHFCFSCGARMKGGAE